MPRKSNTKTFRQNQAKLARSYGIPVSLLPLNARKRALERTGLELRGTSRQLKGLPSKTNPGHEVIVRKGEPIESALRRFRRKKQKPSSEVRTHAEARRNPWGY